MGEGGGTLHQVCVLRYRLRDINNLAHAVIAGLYYALTPGEIVLVVRLLPLPPPRTPSARTHLCALPRVRPALTVRVVQGRATFSDLHIDKQGTGYTLRFTSSLVSSGGLLKPTGKLGHGMSLLPMWLRRMRPGCRLALHEQDAVSFDALFCMLWAC